MKKKDLLQEKIIDPIIRMKPKSVAIEDFLDVIFQVHTRVISAYYIRQGFDIPGLYLVNDAIPTQGITNPFRRTKRGGHIVVRTDDRIPEYVEIEHKGHVFRSNRLEWILIRKFLYLKKGSQEI